MQFQSTHDHEKEQRDVKSTAQINDAPAAAGRLAAIARTAHGTVALFALLAAVLVTITFGMSTPLPAHEPLSGPVGVAFSLGVLYLVVIVVGETRALLAWQRGAPREASLPMAACLTHAGVLVAVLLILWRGASSRSLVGGLDSTLAASGTACVLVLALAAANQLVIRALGGSAGGAHDAATSAGKWASIAQAATALALILALADVERRPLPSSLEDEPAMSSIWQSLPPSSRTVSPRA